MCKMDRRQFVQSLAAGAAYMAIADGMEGKEIDSKMLSKEKEAEMEN